MLINELLGIRYPIFQGAMANIATAEFAAAVSNCGGLGIIATGAMDEVQTRAAIKKCKQLTKQPFGVNVMLMNPHTEAIMQVIIEEKVAVVTTGAGNPGPYIEGLKASGCKVFPVVASVALARRLAKSGVDGLIAEGGESGGHVGETTTMSLVPQVVNAVSIPVIAAGGIASGKQSTPKRAALSIKLCPPPVHQATRWTILNDKPPVAVSLPYNFDAVGSYETHPVVVNDSMMVALARKKCGKSIFYR